MVTKKFGRELRLLTPAEFQNIFKEPTRVHTQHLTLLAKPNSHGHPRLGLTIAKKRIKLAVGRNRVKRRIRETFRNKQHSLPAMDVVLFGKFGISDISNAQLNRELDQLWNKLCRRCKK